MALSGVCLPFRSDAGGEAFLAGGLVSIALDGEGRCPFRVHNANFFAFDAVSRIMTPSGTGNHVLGDSSGTHCPVAERSGGMPVALAWFVLVFSRESPGEWPV